MRASDLPSERALVENGNETDRLGPGEEILPSGVPVACQPERRSDARVVAELMFVQQRVYLRGAGVVVGLQDRQSAAQRTVRGLVLGSHEERPGLDDECAGDTGGILDVAQQPERPVRMLDGGFRPVKAR
jgi:hypothetical protein